MARRFKNTEPSPPFALVTADEHPESAANKLQDREHGWGEVSRFPQKAIDGIGQVCGDLHHPRAVGIVSNASKVRVFRSMMKSTE